MQNIVWPKLQNAGMNVYPVGNVWSLPASRVDEHCDRVCHGHAPAHYSEGAETPHWLRGLEFVVPAADTDWEDCMVAFYNVRTVLLRSDKKCPVPSIAKRVIANFCYLAKVVLATACAHVYRACVASSGGEYASIDYAESFERSPEACPLPVETPRAVILQTLAAHFDSPSDFDEQQAKVLLWLHYVPYLYSEWRRRH